MYRDPSDPLLLPTCFQKARHAHLNKVRSNQLQTSPCGHTVQPLIHSYQINLALAHVHHGRYKSTQGKVQRVSCGLKLKVPVALTVDLDGHGFHQGVKPQELSDNVLEDSQGSSAVTGLAMKDPDHLALLLNLNMTATIEIGQDPKVISDFRPQEVDCQVPARRKEPG